VTVRDPATHHSAAPGRLDSRSRSRLTHVLRLSSAGLLGLAAALLVSCGSSGKGLIPTGDAGPLQSDFETVARDAENGDGNCTATAAAIRKTEQDFGALPASVDAGLRDTLEKGIASLRSHALSLCAQPLAQTTTTSASAPRATHAQTTTTNTATTPTVTQTTSTQTTSTSTIPTTPVPGGGTPAPTTPAPEATPSAGEAQGGTGAGEGAGNGIGQGNGHGNGQGDDQGASQEGGK
jgi:hypothetical protein